MARLFLEEPHRRRRRPRGCHPAGSSDLARQSVAVPTSLYAFTPRSECRRATERGVRIDPVATQATTARATSVGGSVPAFLLGSGAISLFLGAADAKGFKNLRGGRNDVSLRNTAMTYSAEQCDAQVPRIPARAWHPKEQNLVVFLPLFNSVWKRKGSKSLWIREMHGFLALRRRPRQNRLRRGRVRTHHPALSARRCHSDDIRFSLQPAVDLEPAFPRHLQVAEVQTRVRLAPWRTTVVKESSSADTRPSLPKFPAPLSSSSVRSGRLKTRLGGNVLSKHESGRY